MALGWMTWAAIAAIATSSTPPYTVVRSATTTIAVEDEIGDLLVIDGKVQIRGVVRGFVYAVGGEVTAGSTAVLLKPISIKGGTLRLEDGAVLPPSIDLDASRLFRANGSLQPKAGARSSLSLGETNVTLRDDPLPPAKLALMKAVLPFDRFVPPADKSIADLARWHPGLGLELKRDEGAAKELLIGGIARLTFVSEKVSGAFQRGYKGGRGTVLVSGAKLTDEATAKKFWLQIAAIPEDKVTLSVRSALGDGAHWFFRHKGRFCMLWQKGPWFFSVETKLGAESPSIGQEAQFSEQVLTALRNQLEQVKQ